MKNKLIQLAKEAGFKSEIISNDIWKYSNNEELRWLFWMTALQKWLREIHNLHVNIIVDETTYFYSPYKLEIIKISLESSTYHKILNYNYKIEYKTYEEALEEGLLKGLTLIK